MPPNHLPDKPPCDPSVRPEASIPHQRWAKPQRWCDIAVNMQLGPFLAVPFTGVVLALRPHAAESVLAAVPLLLWALRRSRLRYRRLCAT